MGLRLENEVKTPSIIFNNPVYVCACLGLRVIWLADGYLCLKFLPLCYNFDCFSQYTGWLQVLSQFEGPESSY